MGVFSWLFGGRRLRGRVDGDGEFGFDIVGESHRQADLDAIAGGKTEDGVECYCAALLAPDPSNPHDRHAVKVIIRGRHVGFLRRADAKEFGDALEAAGLSDAVVPAVIVGGWRRRSGDEGHYGVKLDIALPYRLLS